MGNESAGPAVDITGRAVADPTVNVKDIVDTAVGRLDDLRTQEARHTRELSDVRSGYIDDIASLRAEYQSELRHAESARINAIRAVDVGNVQRAAEVQATGAGILAQQVAASAEAMRVQVAATAAASQAALNTALDPIQVAIADLRRAQYEGAGQRTQVTESREEMGGKRQSVGVWIAAAAAATAFFFGVGGIIIAIVVGK